MRRELHGRHAFGIDPPDPFRGPDRPGWSSVAAWPNTPWYQELAAWNGAEVLIFGGPVQRGGASGPAPSIRVGHGTGAYSPATDRWRPLSVTPFSLHAAQAVAVGPDMYALTFDDLPRWDSPHLWRYATAEDSWLELTPPPPGRHSDLAAAPGGLVTWVRFPGSHTPSAIAQYDIDSDTWRSAPPTPWEGYRSRSVLGLPDGRVVAVELPADAPDVPSPDRVATWRAAVLDPGAQRWQALPESGIAAGKVTGDQSWVLAGGRVVNADPRRVGAARGFPHGGILDVDAGRWEPLPTLPGEPHEYQSGTKGDPAPYRGFSTRDLLRVAGGDHVAAYGWAFNARHGTWTEIAPVPGDKIGLSYSTALWAGDRLLFWANAKHQRAGANGYRVVRARIGRAWHPGP